MHSMHGGDYEKKDKQKYEKSLRNKFWVWRSTDDMNEMFFIDRNANNVLLKLFCNQFDKQNGCSFIPDFLKATTTSSLVKPLFER